MALKCILFIYLILLLHIKSTLLQKPTGNDNNNPKEFNIGGVLSNNDSEDHFRDTIAVSILNERFNYIFQLIYSYYFPPKKKRHKK